MEKNKTNCTCHKNISGSAEKLCPVETTLSLIGGKYKSLIIWSLIAGKLRFTQLRKEVPRATAKMLTQQLRELEADGLIKRTIYPVVPPKVEYSLTALGISIRPILESMYEWGGAYLHGKGLKVSCGMRPPNKKSGKADSGST